MTKKEKLRKEIEQMVAATNIVLKNKVKEMTLVELLRNIHPLYRTDYARALYKEDMLKENEVKEFA